MDYLTSEDVGKLLNFLFFIGISWLKRDVWLFVEAVWAALSLRVRLAVQDDFCGEATVGQHGEQLITGLHSPWRKCPKPPVPSTLRGPGDPQEKTVHGHAARLGPGPGEPGYGAQSQFEPSEMALASYCLQVETHPDGEAEEETLWWHWGWITG